MSHGDHVSRIAPGFEVYGTSPNAPFAITADLSRQFYAVQFHPELNAEVLKGWLDWGGLRSVGEDGQDAQIMMDQTIAEDEASKQRTFDLVDAYLKDIAKLI